MESPRDKILWDVGHQSYPHKILTGRKDRLETIRQYGGLAPFCSIPESEHDIMGAGHASTSIGYGVGLKEAMRHGIGEDGKVVAVIGDGALTGGVAYEALQQAGGLETPMVIVLNDNGMSISPNVGALSHYFNRFRLNPRLFHAREDVEDRLTKLPMGLGRRIERLGPEIKAAIKAYWAPGLLFEELGIAYMGVIDGHDVADLRWALQRAFEAERPVVVHIHTVKGRGFAAAEEGGLEGMEQWHAAKPGSIVDRRPAPEGQAQARPRHRVRRAGVDRSREARDADPEAGAARLHLRLRQGAGRRGAGATARSSASPPRWPGAPASTSSMDAVPEQYYDVGIAEQDAVLFACGLALQGAKPVCAIYSTFLQRGFDQIVHDVCLQDLNVVFAMDRAGLVGDDGPTHHGVFDISYFRALPNVVLMAPRDEAMLVNMLRTALEHDGPDRLPLPARHRRGRPAAGAAPRDRDRQGRDPPGGRARRAARLRLGSPGRQRRRDDPRRARPAADRRRRPLRQAARRRARRLPRRPITSCSSRSRRTSCPAASAPASSSTSRTRSVPTAPGSCASAFPTATSPTASPRCSARRSA